MTLAPASHQVSGDPELMRHAGPPANTAPGSGQHPGLHGCTRGARSSGTLQKASATVRALSARRRLTSHLGIPAIVFANLINEKWDVDDITGTQ